MVMGEQTGQTQVAVIGGGPGGYAAAFRAADLGLEVTLINAEERLGGVCLLRGCIPVKTYLEVSNLLRKIEKSVDWGLQFEKMQIDVDTLRDRKQKVVSQLVKGLEMLARKRDIQVIQARATFEGAKKLRLEGADIDHVEFEHAILATGTHPRSLPNLDADTQDRVWQTRDALDLPTIPEHLLIIGAGHSGLEIGSIYAALGSRVTLIELLPELLPQIDRDLVAPLQKRMEDTCEQIYLETSLQNVEFKEEHMVATIQVKDQDTQELKVDRILLTVGRTPNTQGLGLEKADVELDQDGFVVVDEEQRTSAEHIFAVGDMTGFPMVAHKALQQGRIAADVIAGKAAAFDVRCIPTVVYVDPQLAICGLNAEEAGEAGYQVEVGSFPWRASGRAHTKGAQDGLTKLVFDAETQRILGVGIVGPGAENMIAETTLAIEMGARAQDLALTLHPHPTLSETEQEAAEAFLGTSTHQLN